jgi:hypothetical protein
MFWVWRQEPSQAPALGGCAALAQEDAQMFFVKSSLVNPGGPRGAGAASCQTSDRSRCPTAPGLEAIKEMRGAPSVVG